MKKKIEFMGYVKHLESGRILPYYQDTEKGFLWIQPFREAGLGIDTAPVYFLKKPYWILI